MPDSFLSRTGQAVVLVDADAPDFAQAALEVETYFREKGIPMQLRAVHRKRFIWARRKTDLLISLLPSPSWHLSWVAVFSKAAIKAGRFQPRLRQVFDLVVSDPPLKTSTQTEVFRQITKILSTIQ